MKNILLVATFFLSVISHAQISGYTSDLQELNARYFRNSQLNNNRYDEIKGSPFLDDKFHTAKISFAEGKPVFAEMRYNIFTDKFEYLKGNQVFEVVNDSQIETIELGSKTFISLNQKYYDSDKGYFQIVYEDSVVKLLKKYKVKFYEKTPEKPVVGSTPARFSSPDETYYISKHDMLDEFRIKKSSFYNLKPDRKNDIKNFIEKNNISLDKDEDLKVLMEFVSSLD